MSEERATHSLGDGSVEAPLWRGMQRADPTAGLARQEQVQRIITDVIGGLARIRHWHPLIREGIASLERVQGLLKGEGR